ncbi:hypothetical protein CLI64_22245 [Nostoc sp. CENA543]|uniref:hypothetical protein n=1 Tax=Nostoc sp. CENA543 TaxID=1869241 RepID=UPI000CA3A45B|nr:hypothetical protein [Nostoc sp. CENA543]AUT02906.1 hypothetical protein CLI64_22245 [Nostoc sp. CENA543]
MISTNTDNFVSILTQVAIAYREKNHPLPATAAIVNALLAAETTAKQQRLNYEFDSLVGTWRLCFATGTKKARERGGIILGKGWYVPKLAKIQISFSADSETDSNRGEIGNQVKLGAILLQLTGPAKYLGKKNILAFDFTQMFLQLFGRTIYQQKIRSGKSQSEDFYNQPIAKQAFFAFFLVNADLIAARGRGGGLALWVRENV